MKRRTLLIILCLQIINVFAQTYTPFPMVNATWTMDIQNQGGGPPYPPPIIHDFNFYKTNGDTLINGHHYAIIDKSDFSKYCFIRQENGYIYCKYSESTNYDTSEFILYNFNFKLGDTVQLPMAGNPIFYYDGIVESIDSILIGNKYHKRIGVYSWIYFDFVEGVGSLQGLLYSEIPWVDHWADLTCFSRNDTIYSLNGTGNFSLGNCWQMLNRDDQEENHSIVYPNPSSKTIYITGKTVKNVKLYNVSGQKILESHLQMIDVSHLENGIYFLNITEVNNKQWNVKIIKNNAP